MNLYGYSLQKGVIFSACIEMVAATINMILSAAWAGDLNFCHSLPPRYEPCIRYRVYVSMAVISAWIILCDLLICWAAFQKNLKVMRICVPLSLFVTIANVSILGVLAGYYRRSALAGVIIYLCVYMIFKCYFMPMIKNFYMVLFVENGGVLVTQISPYLGGGIYPNMQKPYPNVQYPQGQNQNPIPPPSYEQQQYPNAQQPYPNIQQPYPNVQQPYPNVQQPYPNVQQPYPNVQQPYPNVQQPYPNVQQPYPNVQQPYPNVQQPYPNVQQPYPNGQQPYPNDQQTYPNDPQSFPNVPSYISKY